MTGNASDKSNARKVATYFISNTDCVNEEKLIRDGLGGVTGIEQLDFDLRRRRLQVTHTLENDESLVAAFNALMLFVAAAFILYEAYGRFRDPRRFIRPPCWRWPASDSWST